MRVEKQVVTGASQVLPGGGLREVKVFKPIGNGGDNDHDAENRQLGIPPRQFVALLLNSVSAFGILYSLAGKSLNETTERGGTLWISHSFS